MNLPCTPVGWASRLIGLVYQCNDAAGLPRLPIDVREVAREYSRNAFPDAPITLIEGEDFGDQFEGALLPDPKGSGQWGIFYNNASGSEGRINFTLAHEFGHYLLHRLKFPEGKKCTNQDLRIWGSPEAIIESEANEFASSFLMPLDDFREQIKGQKVTLAILDRLKSRYEVSLSAVILRWLSFTRERAMVVVGKDGFIDWARSSEPLFKSGIYYRSKQETIELPEKSLAAKRDESFDNINGVVHAQGVWLGEGEVHEMTVFTEQYNNLSISLLIYGGKDLGVTIGSGFEEKTEDSVDYFARRGRR